MQSTNKNNAYDRTEIGDLGRGKQKQAKKTKKRNIETHSGESIIKHTDKPQIRDRSTLRVCERRSLPLWGKDSVEIPERRGVGINLYKKKKRVIREKEKKGIPQ